MDASSTNGARNWTAGAFIGLVYRQKVVNSDKAGGAQLILMVSRKPRRVMMSKSHWDNVIGGV